MTNAPVREIRSGASKDAAGNTMVFCAYGKGFRNLKKSSVTECRKSVL